MVNDTLASGDIHFTGLGSSTDFDSIIEKLIQVESIKKQRLEQWQSTWEKKVEGFQDLNTKLLSLKTSLEGMDRVNEFVVKNTTSTDATALSATAGAEAEEGTYVFSVNQLAQNQIVTFTGTSESSLNDVVNSSGSDKIFSYTYKGSTQNITVPNGTSLQTLINLINADGDNPGVRASAIMISDGVYRLQLKGLDTGATNTLTIASGTSLSGYFASNASITQTAQNAEIRINGFPSNAWLSRSSNSVTDLVPGLTVQLKATAASVSLSVARDTEAIKEQIRNFVTQVNDVRSYLKELTKFDSTSKQGSLLTGNYGVAMIGSNLQLLTASKATGFEYYDSATGKGDMFSSLSQLGILTEAASGSVNAGLLVIDEDKLDEALENNLDQVADLFSAYYKGSAQVTTPANNPAAFTYASHIDGTTQGGSYAVSYTVAGGTVTSATINGQAASYDSETGQITSLAGSSRGLAINVNTLTDGSYQGTVSLKVGKTTEMIDEIKRLTDSREGTLGILEDNYDDIIDNIQKKIESEERRLTAKERELRDRFARLEATLSNYNGIQTQLQNQIKGLDSSK